MRYESHALSSCLVLLLTSVAQANEYVVRWKASESLMEVRWCGQKSTTLRAFDQGLVDRTTFAMGAVNRIGQRAQARTRCVDYQVDLAPLLGNNDFRSGAYYQENILVVRADQWLWRPTNVALTLSFEHLPDHAVSSPWTLLEREATRTTFRRPVSPSGNNRIAIGALSPIELAPQFSSVRAHALFEPEQAQRNKLATWLNNGLRSAEALYGWMPDLDPQILLIETESDSAVQFGQVLRTGGNSVTFFINPNAATAEFVDDWTATHEFVHLLLPYLGGEGRWLAEGLASYYQYIAQGKAGILEADQVFERLAAGFQRGRDNINDDSTFLQASDNVRASGQYRRVYWSGAAVIFLIDTQLITQSEGQLTVSDVLGRYAQCCLEDRPKLSATEFIAELDRLSNTKLFSSHFEYWLHQPGFPDVTPAWQRIDISVDQVDQVTLKEPSLTRQMMLSPES
ncbi:MAG: hypothetical protein DHS20C11_29660 [Lysobacteraceae bacterium]|nr:MAG: hypothetical protein DHS20C11_29660 [Xanthomonadaceae bacterium]